MGNVDTDWGCIGMTGWMVVSSMSGAAVLFRVICIGSVHWVRYGWNVIRLSVYFHDWWDGCVINNWRGCFVSCHMHWGVYVEWDMDEMWYRLSVYWHDWWDGCVINEGRGCSFSCYMHWGVYIEWDMYGKWHILSVYWHDWLDGCVINEWRGCSCFVLYALGVILSINDRLS